MRKRWICWRRWSPNYAGTLLLVSHDRAFLDNVVTSTLVFEGGGQVNEYVGGYSDWLRQRMVGGARPRATRRRRERGHAARRTGAVKSPAAAAEGTALVLQGAARTRGACRRKFSASKPNRLQLQTAIGDPELFQARTTSAAPPRCSALQSLAAELESAYARWDALES